MTYSPSLRYRPAVSLLFGFRASLRILLNNEGIVHSLARFFGSENALW
jgi:hypothetical protein